MEDAISCRAKDEDLKLLDLWTSSVHFVFPFSTVLLQFPLLSSLPSISFISNLFNLFFPFPSRSFHDSAKR
ncbi:hypothetical protein SDJN03_28586, partial [Cucurbita argyrosperma subsp. sororia]